MKYKVRIKNAPMQKGREGMQVDYGLDTPLTAMGGANTMSPMSQYATTRSITGVPREEANLEAEGGETVYGDINGDGMPEQNIIKGPRHSEGGVPLNLPEGTFIFSDTKSMRVKDCEILEMFNKPCGKKSYTPAELAKVFDLNAYREILQDPNSDKLDVRTAERMLKNYTIKLGALALAQEAMKGFPQGIPAVAEPYIQAAGINPEEVMPPKEMVSMVENLKKDAQQNQSPEGMPVDPQGVQQAVGMNDGRPVAVPTDAQQPMAQQQMMPPQMQQPQEMLGQPMPGMMPPQEQMMSRGGYMELGGYDMPFVMATGGAMQYYNGGAKQKVRITELPKANNGKIVIDKNDPKFKDANGAFDPYAYEEALYNANASGKDVFNEKGQKLTGSVKTDVAWDNAYDPDGELAKMYGTEDPANPGTFTMSDEQKLIAANQYLTDKYLNEPKTQSLIAKNIREAIKDSVNYIGKRGNVYESEASVLQEINNYGHTDKDGNPLTFGSIADVPDEILIQGLTDQNHQAARIKAAGINTKAFKDSGTGYKSENDIIAAGITNPDTGELVTDSAGVTALKAAYTELGITGGNLRSAYASPKSKVLEQASYLGFMKTANDKKSYAPGSEQAFAARYITPTELGEGDEPSLYGSATTTPIDGFEGNTDLGQTAQAVFSDFAFDDPEDPEDPDPDPDCACEDENGNMVPTGERDADGNCPPCREVEVITRERPEAAWWLQDTINTFGAMGDASMIQKDQPFDRPVDLDAPLARYDDPTKDLDQNLGILRQTVDTMSQFADGPQGLTSRMSQAAGQAAKNATNITQKYNSSNLQRNQNFEKTASEVVNKERLANRQINKGLYDATMLADANFNKEKLGARINRRGLYNTAITNRRKTQALNAMYPDYAVDPSDGGSLVNVPNPKDPNPSRSDIARRQKLIDDYVAQGYSPKEAAAAVNAVYGAPSSGGSNNNGQAALMAQFNNVGRSPQSYTKQGKIGGPVGYYVYGGDVYPF